MNTLSGEQIVLDVAQNGYAPDNTVYSKAASLYEAPNQGGNGAEGNAAESSRVRWVVMPLNMGYPATREYLGSNFKEELAHAS